MEVGTIISVETVGRTPRKEVLEEHGYLWRVAGTGVWPGDRPYYIAESLATGAQERFWPDGLTPVTGGDDAEV